MGFQLEEVVFEEEGRRRLGPVSVQLQGKEMVGVVGPNGSGKSTFLRLLYGYLTAARGSVLLDGRGLPTIPPRELASRVSACPQEAEPSLDFSVEQAVALVTQGDVARAKQQASAFDFLALEPLWGRRLSQLSGGEKQRVRLARTLLTSADWMVLDEPANHLDLATGWSLMDRLRQLSVSGGVLVALHDLSMATRFCHRLLVLKEGVCVAFDQPGTALTPEILDTVFGLQGSVATQGDAFRLEITGVSQR